MDFTQPENNLHGFVKLRGSLAPEDVVFWWVGYIYSYVPGQRSRPLFQFEGFNVARTVEVGNGYQMLTREAAFYKDVQTGEILEHWHNPLTNEEVDVVHVWNDPVNQELLLNGPNGPFNIAITDLGDDLLCWHLDVFLAYPSPLPRAQYPRYSQNDLYQGGELFQFFARRTDLENEALATVPCHNTWTRIGPWLPWMYMEDRPGHVIYHCRGCKLRNGYPDLPTHVRAYVEAHQPQYAHAPEVFTRPNETSWTYMKKLLDERAVG